MGGLVGCKSGRSSGRGDTYICKGGESVFTKKCLEKADSST